MKAELESAFSEIDIKLIESGGGVFEVVRDGDLLHSKKATGAFPNHADLIKAIKAA